MSYWAERVAAAERAAGVTTLRCSYCGHHDHDGWMDTHDTDACQTCQEEP